MISMGVLFKKGHAGEFLKRAWRHLSLFILVLSVVLISSTGSTLAQDEGKTDWSLAFSNMRGVYDFFINSTFLRRYKCMVDADGSPLISHGSAMGLGTMGIFKEPDIRKKAILLEYRAEGFKPDELLNQYKKYYAGLEPEIGRAIPEPSSLFARYPELWEPKYIYAIDGRLEMPDEVANFTLGASHLIYENKEDGDGDSALTKLDGRLKLTDILTLSGEFAQQSGGQVPGEEVRADPRTKIGLLSIGATYEAVDAFPIKGREMLAGEEIDDDSWTRISLTDLMKLPNDTGDNEEDEPHIGSGTSTTTTKLGLTIGEPSKRELQVDHELTAIRDPLDERSTGFSKATTSFALKYALTDAMMLHAGYRTANPLMVPEGKGDEITTRFGLGYKVPLNEAGLLRAYYLYERNKEAMSLGGYQEMLAASTGLEYKLTEETKLKANYLFRGSATAGRMLSTSLGVDYFFNMDAVLSIGYNMVDFDTYIEGKEFRTMTMAEMSIKF